LNPPASSSDSARSEIAAIHESTTRNAIHSQLFSAPSKRSVSKQRLKDIAANGADAHDRALCLHGVGTCKKPTEVGQ
jgi:hypothetical protein